MQDQQGLAPLYRLLSRVLAREIDGELVAALSREPITRVLEPLIPGFEAYLASFDEAAKEAADEEYCALFLLPGGVSPRVAAWMPGELATVGAQISRQVQHHLDRLGRDVAGGPWGKLPLDHVSLLLDLAAADNDLVDELVTPWAADFGKALATRAACPVYCATGEVLCSL